MPNEPNSAVPARKPRSWVRPVVCACGGPTWLPTSSGGSSWPVHRWICCRSSGSMQSLAQTRSVRSRTSRSTRRPPDEHDSISTPGVAGAQLVEQPVERDGLGVHAGPPVRAAARVEQVAVVVPLQVARSGTRSAGRRAARGCRRRPRGGRGRAPAGCATAAAVRPPVRQHPVGVRAGEVGVEVDHLRLDPQPELHAEPAHGVDQRVQAVAATRPRRRTSRPARRCRRGGAGTSRRRARSARRRPPRPRRPAR